MRLDTAMNTEFDALEVKAATLLTTVGAGLNGAKPLKANDSAAFRDSVEMLSLLRGGTPIQQIYRPLPLNVFLTHFAMSYKRQRQKSPALPS